MERLKDVGSIVKKVRTSKGMTRRKLCTMADITEKHLTLIENQGANFSVLVLIKLAKALQVLPHELLEEDPSSNREKAAMLHSFSEVMEKGLMDAKLRKSIALSAGIKPEELESYFENVKEKPLLKTAFKLLETNDDEVIKEAEAFMQFLANRKKPKAAK